MESVGARLKKIRLEKGLTMDDVHKKTKIHLNVLKAIEEDRLINVSPVYVKGFLKIYCQFLEVDPKDFIPDYKEASQVLVAASAGKLDSGNDPGGPLLKAMPLKPFFHKLPIKPRAVAAIILAVVCVLVVFSIGKFIFSRHSQLPRRSRPPAVAVPRMAKRPVAAKAHKPPSGPSLQASPAAVAVQPEPAHVQELSKEIATGIRLAVLAKEDCWINLKSDGKVVFHGSLKKGRTETWQAKERLELSVNNAGVLNLEVNGKLITNLGRRGQALKNIVITREGMTIGQ
ncbi:MAG TPA: RodZ domain-containing protein [Patescibacteria group bacterium]|nr:RodZ domain-containing protein [Patescibacteria group bacterium]